MVHAIALGLILGQSNSERKWRIELPKEPTFTVRLPSDWTPRSSRRAGAPSPSPRPGVATTILFESPGSGSMMFGYFASASAEDRKALMDRPPTKVGKRIAVVSRTFKRGRWTVAAGGVRSSTIGFMRPDMTVAMTDGKALRFVEITAPKGGVQPSEALAVRICGSITPAFGR